MNEISRENDYILTKGDSVQMHRVKFWTIGEYYTALEQLLKDKDRAEQQAKQIKNTR